MVLETRLSSGLCSLIKKFHLNFLYLSNSIRLKVWCETFLFMATEIPLETAAAAEGSGLI